MGVLESLNTKVSFHPSVILWLSVLGYLQPRIVLPFILSVLLHEGGHFLALQILKQPPRRVIFTLGGARMETPELSYQQEFWTALAGPATSLLLGLTLPLWPMLGGYSLCLGFFNLLPLGSLDGGRMLRCFLLIHFSQASAQLVFRIVTVVTGILLLLPGLYATVYAQMGLWPLLICAGLLYKALMEGLL